MTWLYACNNELLYNQIAVKNLKKNSILVLNKHYFPVAVEGIQKTFGNIFSGSVVPLDIIYEEDENGNVNFENIEYFNSIATAQEWLEMPIRTYDDYIHTTRGPVRVPQVVVCSNFSKIIFNKVQFPTKHNIYKRDDYTCMYTNRKLAKHELSIDHVVPRSKGGRDTWENLVCCDRAINSKKSDMTLNEAKLKLRYKPFQPKNGLTFEIYKDEWFTFLKSF